MLSRDGCKLGGTMIGQKVSDGIALTAAPTAVENQPILTTDLDVYLDTTSAGLGTTKLLRALKANITIGNRFAPLWVMNSANGSFVTHIETVPKVNVELMVEADALGMAQLTQLRGGTTMYLRVQATSALLAGTAFPYQFQFDLAGKISAVADYSDENGVYAIQFTHDAIYDPAWGTGTSWQASVTNKQITL